MVTERSKLARLLTVQQRLLELSAGTPFDVAALLDQAATLVQEALGAEKVDVFLHDPARAALVAMGISASDPAARGSGLGLAVARAIAERHGGRLWAAHAPEGGAAFHLTLPHSSEAEAIT